MGKIMGLVARKLKQTDMKAIQNKKGRSKIMALKKISFSFVLIALAILSGCSKAEPVQPKPNFNDFSYPAGDFLGVWTVVKAGEYVLADYPDIAVTTFEFANDGTFRLRGQWSDHDGTYNVAADTVSLYYKNTIGQTVDFGRLVITTLSNTDMHAEIEMFIFTSIAFSMSDFDLVKY